MTIEKKIWEIYPEILAAVRKSHEEVNLVGHHDWIHVCRVAEVAYRIGMDEYNGVASLAGIAGLCHNADRILEKKRIVVSEESVRGLLNEWLVSPSLNAGSKELIANAVLKHNQRNGDDDSAVLVVLMDADRVISLDVDLFPRSGQNYCDLPVVDYRNLWSDPEATYRSPKTVLRDISYSLEWADLDNKAVGVRTRLGKKMAAKRAAIFRMFFNALRDQLGDEGVYPYPF